MIPSLSLPHSNFTFFFLFQFLLLSCGRFVRFYLREPPVLGTPPSYLIKKEKSNISLVSLSVYAYDSKTKVHCGSAIGPGASGLPCYCAPLVCVPTVIGVLTVWRHNKPKTKNNLRN